MPSRKKAQGQARRRAKAAKAKDNETEQAREKDSLPLQNLQELVIESLALVTTHDDGRCLHGFTHFPANHVCAEFIHGFITTFTSAFFSICDVSDDDVLFKALGMAIIEAIDENNECLADTAKMEAIVSFFLYLGAQDILDGGGYARLIASSAAYFEQYIAMVLLKLQQQFNLPRCWNCSKLTPIHL